jgi:hypothetical protein
MAVRPYRESADDQKNEDDEKNRSEHRCTCFAALRRLTDDKVVFYIAHA